MAGGGVQHIFLKISPHPHPELFKIDFTPLTNPRKGMGEWERKERVRPEANILKDFFRNANKGERGQKWAKLSERTFYKWSHNYHEIVCSNSVIKVILREAYAFQVEPTSPSYRIYFMIGPLNLTIIYLLRVLLIRNTKTMIKIKRPPKIVGPKYSSAQIYVTS